MLAACTLAAAAPSKPPTVKEALVTHGVEEIVFANRKTYADGHWYANIGYWCDDETD